MIWELLQIGEANARSTAEIMEISGISTVRELRARVAAERNAGRLICSTKRASGGYYRPGDRDELYHYVQCAEREAKSSLRTLKSARRALRQLDGQTKMLPDEKMPGA